MKKVLTAVVAAATLAAATITVPTAADARGGRNAAIFGGLAAGALIGGALMAAPRYYAPPAYYYAPAPVYYGPGPGCWRRERVWTYYGWAFRRIYVC